MPPAASATLPASMVALRQQYVERLAETGAMLARHAQDSMDGPLADAVREEVRMAAHKLAGTGTTYGFPEISRTARVLEEMLLAGTGEDEGLGDALTALIASLSDAEAQAKEDAGSGQGADAGALPARVDDHPHAKPVLLVVDDDPQLRSVVIGALSDHAQVLTAANSAQAMSRIAETRPDFMLLDDIMPDGMKGLRLLEHCASLAINPLAQTRTIMITADARASRVRQAADLGVVGFIAKPFTIDSLHHRMLPLLQGLQANRLHRKTIFVADDDVAVRNLLCDALGDAGYRTLFAGDGDEATKLLGLENPDLILLDIALPGRNGVEILQEVRKNPRLTRTPVIMVTANRDAEMVKTALKWGAAGYCVKPFAVDDVVDRCRRLLA